MAKKKQPKIFQRKGDYAYAYTPADEVRFTYNGWTEVKQADPAEVAAVDESAGSEADSTSTNAGKAAKATPKKAS